MSDLRQRVYDLAKARLLCWAYREVFGAPGAHTRAQRIVLADQARWCHARTTTLQADSHATASLEGRRQAWLRIQHFLAMPDEELTAQAQRLAQEEGGLQ